GGGVFGPSAAGRVSPDSMKMRATLRTTRLHHALNLAKPHGLEELQALSDHRGKVHRDRVPGIRVRGKVGGESLAGKGNDLGFELGGRGERELIGRDERRPSDRLSGRALFYQHVLFPASYLHRERQSDAAAGDQIDTFGGV